jgi:hypothetical protein
MDRIAEINDVMGGNSDGYVPEKAIYYSYLTRNHDMAACMNNSLLRSYEYLLPKAYG